MSDERQYVVYPGLDNEYNFPPEVRAKLASSPELTNTFVAPRQPIVAMIGDSYTANGATFSDPTFHITTANSYWPWAQALTGHGFEVAQFSDTQVPFATAGYTIDQMITAGYHTAAAASAANVVVILAGRNNLSSDTPDVILSKVQTLMAPALAAGKPVIVCTLPAGASTDSAATTTALQQFNFLLKSAYAGGQVKNVYLCDWHSALLDPSTGHTMTGLVNPADGLHPLGSGSIRMAQRIAPILTSLLPVSSTPWLDLADSDARAVTPNGFALGNTSGVPTSWGVFSKGSPTSVVSSVLARTDGVPGQWAKTVIQAATATTDGVQVRVNQGTGGKWVVGDTVLGVAEIETDSDVAWDARSIYANLTASGGSVATNTLYQSSNELPNVTQPLTRPNRLVLVTPTLVVPTGTTNLQASVYFYGSGSFRIGRFRVVKVN